MMKLSVSAVLLMLIAGCASNGASTVDPSSPIGQLALSLASRFDDPQYDHMHWGVIVRSLRTGETVYSRNAQKLFMPASNMKLFTSSSASQILGWDYRYVTRLVTTGTVKDSVLTGDVIIVGSGDPTISGRFDSGRVTIAFEQWADSLRLRGIKKVNGRIIGDDNCFEDEWYGSGWSSDYETDYYAAQISGLCFNDNCVDITVTPAVNAGDPCTLTVVPATSYVTFINKTKTVAVTDSANDIWFERKRGSNFITVYGTISSGKKPWLESVTVENPTLFTTTVLKEVLQSKGITVNGAAMDADDLPDTLRYPDARTLATFISLPYSEIIKVINKPSHNMYAEQTFRTMGKERSGVGSMQSGRAAVKPVLAQFGVDTLHVRFADGSGLSRQDLVSPNDVVAVLTAMKNSASFDTFYTSLPIAGIDGTLRNRMRGTRAEMNVHAKTGTIGYVSSLSGYVTSADGEMFVFSLMANHFTVPTSQIIRVQNDVCSTLAGFSRTTP